MGWMGAGGARDRVPAPDVFWGALNMIRRQATPVEARLDSEANQGEFDEGIHTPRRASAVADIHLSCGIFYLVVRRPILYVCSCTYIDGPARYPQVAVVTREQLAQRLASCCSQEEAGNPQARRP